MIDDRSIHQLYKAARTFGEGFHIYLVARYADGCQRIGQTARAGGRQPERTTAKTADADMRIRPFCRHALHQEALAVRQQSRAWTKRD